MTGQVKSFVQEPESAEETRQVLWVGGKSHLTTSSNQLGLRFFF